MATNAPQDDWHKTGLRLPKYLHGQLHEAAALSGRSYNAEIVARLEQSFGGTAVGSSFVEPFDSTAALKRFADQLDKMMLERHQAYRAEMIKEFGYDPDAPVIKREPNKGPVRSSNAKQPKK